MMTMLSLKSEPSSYTKHKFSSELFNYLQFPLAECVLLSGSSCHLLLWHRSSEPMYLMMADYVLGEETINGGELRASRVEAW